MSLRKAIDAMCKDCTYDPYEKGTWRKQVENCDIAHCPLHRVRPMTFASKSHQKQGKN
jgi:hypothetical protein